MIYWIIVTFITFLTTLIKELIQKFAQYIIITAMASEAALKKRPLIE